MQLGSGTFDLDPGLTYLGESRRMAWMLQSAATVRLGANSRDYRLGNSVRVRGRLLRVVVVWDD